MKNILLPIDISEAHVWQKTLDEATAIARREGATLHVLWVVPELERRLAVRPADHRPEVEDFVKKTFADSDVEAKPMLKAGSTHREIRAAAEEIDADLIVIGSHDPRWSDSIIGSNAAHVALHSDCSVYVVR